jgi:hypothetical protein
LSATNGVSGTTGSSIPGKAEANKMRRNIRLEAVVSSLAKQIAVITSFQSSTYLVSKMQNVKCKKRTGLLKGLI